MRCGADQWNEGQKGKGNIMGNLKQTLQKLWNRLGALWNRLHRPAPGKIMYIGGTDPLPPPLPRQEEALLLKRLDEGDETVKSTPVSYTHLMAKSAGTTKLKRNGA